MVFDEFYKILYTFGLILLIKNKFKENENRPAAASALGSHPVFCFVPGAQQVTHSHPCHSGHRHVAVGGPGGLLGAFSLLLLLLLRMMHSPFKTCLFPPAASTSCCTSSALS